MLKNELFRIQPNVFFPCSPHSEAYQIANDFQIKQQEPEESFFGVRPKLGSVSFLLDWTRSQSSMIFKFPFHHLYVPDLNDLFFCLVD